MHGNLVIFTVQDLEGDIAVAIGMIGRAGTTQSALATMKAIRQWNPHYILFSGIAGGFHRLEKGDVVIADVIYGYEYGKIDKKYMPRGNWTYKTDLGLLNLANAYAIRKEWLKRISSVPPKVCEPKVVCGDIVSGDKVVDDPENPFFAKVLKAWPKVIAVEMESAGIGNAIEQAVNLSDSVNFMIIRGISDLPLPVKRSNKKIQNKERDIWKSYAANTAAAFAIGLIADGLPVAPYNKP